MLLLVACSPEPAPPLPAPASVISPTGDTATAQGPPPAPPCALDWVRISTEPFETVALQSDGTVVLGARASAPMRYGLGDPDEVPLPAPTDSALIAAVEPSDGSLRWWREVAAPTEEGGYSVPRMKVLPDDRLLVAIDGPSVVAPGSPLAHTLGLDDAYAGWWSAEGELERGLRVEGSRVSALAVSPSGRVALVGLSTSTVSIGGQEVLLDDDDYATWLALTDEAGEVILASSYEDPLIEPSVTFDPDGQLAVAGGLPNDASSDQRIVAFDPDTVEPLWKISTDGRPIGLLPEKDRLRTFFRARDPDLGFETSAALVRLRAGEARLEELLVLSQGVTTERVALHEAFWAISGYGGPEVSVGPLYRRSATPLDPLVLLFEPDGTPLCLLDLGSSGASSSWAPYGAASIQEIALSKDGALVVVGSFNGVLGIGRDDPHPVWRTGEGSADGYARDGFIARFTAPGSR